MVCNKYKRNIMKLKLITQHYIVICRVSESFTKILILFVLFLHVFYLHFPCLVLFSYLGSCTLLALKMLFNPLVQHNELHLLNRNKNELITITYEQFSSTEDVPTVTRSLVSFRHSFDLLHIHRKIDIRKDFLLCL